VGTEAECPRIREPTAEGRGPYRLRKPRLPRLRVRLPERRFAHRQRRDAFRVVPLVQPRPLTLRANELGSGGLLVFVKLVGVHQPRGVFVRVFPDRREQRVFV